tara:strand:- start:220 stop:564 length:345 start_codon:yes stop_codon:yes gene_type:complete
LLITINERENKMNKFIKQVSEANNSMGKYGNYINPETAETWNTDELYVLFEVVTLREHNRVDVVAVSTMYSPKKIHRIVKQHYPSKYYTYFDFFNGGYDLDISRNDLQTLEEKY